MEINEKEYEITATDKYLEYEKLAKTTKYWAIQIQNNPKQLAMCRKWVGKKIKLSEIPTLITEVGEVILDNDTVDIYNGYRE